MERIVSCASRGDINIYKQKKKVEKEDSPSLLILHRISPYLQVCYSTVLWQNYPCQDGTVHGKNQSRALEQNFILITGLNTAVKAYYKCPFGPF